MIKILTHLHEGIYKSDGGGETRCHYKWATGPRNLMKAIKTLDNHRADMIASYGNVGCGGSWIEIDGVEITHDDIAEYRHDTDKSNFAEYTHIHAVSKTEWCKKFIAGIKS